jgi:hypothetical protein
MSTGDYESAVMEFLRQPENLETALEIAERVQDLKVRLILDFWRTLRDKIRGERDLPGWCFELDTEMYKAAHWSGLTLQPALKGELYLRLALVQEPKGLRAGVVWNKENREDLGTFSEKYPELKGLLKCLAEWEPAVKPSTWWLSFSYVHPHPILDRRTLVSISNETLVAPVAREYVRWIDKFSGLLKRVNDQLSGAPVE